MKYFPSPFQISAMYVTMGHNSLFPTLFCYVLLVGSHGVLKIEQSQSLENLVYFELMRTLSRGAILDRRKKSRGGTMNVKRDREVW